MTALGWVLVVLFVPLLLIRLTWGPLIEVAEDVERWWKRRRGRR